jgi:hypothetical protein
MGSCLGSWNLQEASSGVPIQEEEGCYPWSKVYNSFGWVLVKVGRTFP